MIARGDVRTTANQDLDRLCIAGRGRVSQGASAEFVTRIHGSGVLKGGDRREVTVRDSQPERLLAKLRIAKHRVGWKRRVIRVHLPQGRGSLAGAAGGGFAEPNACLLRIGRPIETVQKKHTQSILGRRIAGLRQPPQLLGRGRKVLDADVGFGGLERVCVGGGSGARN